MLTSDNTYEYKMLLEEKKTLIENLDRLKRVN